jgi:catechol 2,3-dioxygenase-like lactoylglutathione lyase family enzyme
MIAGRNGRIEAKTARDHETRPRQAQWHWAKGAGFLTEPKDHAREIRAYIRDPDGHLIEAGPSKARPDAS